MKIDYTCKLCGKPGAIILMPDVMQIWTSLPEGLRSILEKMITATSHNRCYEIWETCNLLERGMRGLLWQFTGNETEADQASLRKLLAAKLRAWCANEARRFQVQPTELWQSDIVAAIMRSPEDIAEHLKDARERTRKLSRDPAGWDRWESEREAKAAKRKEVSVDWRVPVAEDVEQR